MNPNDELVFEVRLENLPGPKGVAVSTKATRGHLAKMGEFLKRVSVDPEYRGVNILMRSDGQITLNTILT